MLKHGWKVNSPLPRTGLTLKAKASLFISLCLLSWLCLSVFNDYYDLKIIRTILRLSALPASVDNVECKSPLFATDVITTCYLEISPADFNRLLAGHTMKPAESNTTSHQHSSLGLIVGEEFPVTMEYSTHPETFIHGGHILILTNREKNKLIVDLYEE